MRSCGVRHADGSFRKRLAAIAKVDLVVIDDFAIFPQSWLGKIGLAANQTPDEAYFNQLDLKQTV